MAAYRSTELRKIEVKRAAAVQQVCDQAMQERAMAPEYGGKPSDVLVAAQQVQRDPSVLTNAIGQSVLGHEESSVVV